LTCAPPPDIERELGLAAHLTRIEMFRAAGLPTVDDVPAPDNRFEQARRILGPGAPLVVAAVRARNALADSADPLVRAVAHAFAERVGSLSRDDARQAGAEGAQRAAELFNPAEGTWRGYARQWIRKRISAAADASRAVRIGERARLAGDRVVVVEFAERKVETETEIERLEALASAEAEVDRLDEALSRLGPIERAAIVAAHGLNGADPLPPRAAAAALGIGTGRYADALARGMEQLAAYLRGELPAEKPQLGLFELR
jgi:RNA polymerase sigma factor (sigma-70 family)